MDCFDVQQNPNKIKLKIDSWRDDDDLINNITMINQEINIEMGHYNFKGFYTPFYFLHLGMASFEDFVCVCVCVYAKILL